MLINNKPIQGNIIGTKGIIKTPIQCPTFDIGQYWSKSISPFNVTHGKETYNLQMENQRIIEPNACAVIQRFIIG